MLRALGKINPTPGTPIQVISLLPPVPPSGYPEKIHGVMVQARRANVGYAFVGTNLMNPALDTGLFATLAVPTRNSIPSFTAALTLASNAITLDDLWIDVETLGDGVIVSVLIA
jgi:hypothetical protein